MKKVLSVLLATTLLSISLFGCGSTPAQETPAAEAPATEEAPAAEAPATEEAPVTEEASAGDEFSGDVTLKVMLMPQGEMNSDTVAQVTEAVNARIAALGYQFKVEFSWTGGAWGWENLNNAFQTGAVPDIVPAHGWSGQISYLVGAQTGQYLRLDNPDNNLLEKYGKDMYANTNPLITSIATVEGDQGTGLYGYVIEKDSVSQLGFLVNETTLNDLGFDIADFNPTDILSWEPMLAAYKAKYPDKYPLNIEAEVLDRAVNFVSYIGGPERSLGIVFDNDDIEGSAATAQVTSRYENPAYQEHIANVRTLYEAGYIDPDLGVAGEISSNAIAAHRNNGDFLFATFIYAPGAENPIAAAASAETGTDVKITWVPAWKSAIATGDTAIGSGLAVYAGTQYAPEAVTFLNILASDQEMGNLLAEGVEGVSYEIKDDGIAWRIGDRAGWSIWRYGAVGCATPATPLGDVDPTGNEWANFKTFNSQAVGFTHWLFNSVPVQSQYDACTATISKYAIPLGSGAASPEDYDAFIAELKSVGIDEVVTEAQAQLAAYNQ